MRHKIFTGLGFEKCHSLSMQPIFKLFLKAVADSKIPDHETLIFFLDNFTRFLHLPLDDRESKLA